MLTHTHAHLCKMSFIAQNFEYVFFTYRSHLKSEAISPPDSSGSGKIARLTVLDDSTKEAIMNMSKPSEMPYEERKRQYAALYLWEIMLITADHHTWTYANDGGFDFQNGICSLIFSPAHPRRRAVIKEANPALLNKYQAANDKERFLWLLHWFHSKLLQRIAGTSWVTYNNYSGLGRICVQGFFWLAKVLNATCLVGQPRSWRYGNWREVQNDRWGEQKGQVRNSPWTKNR